MTTALPKGVKDFLPERAARLSSISAQIGSVFRLFGYKEVITPCIEYLDSLALAEPELVPRMFKLEDRVSGKMLALRPDITAQMARLVSSHLREHPKPLRLSYSGSILHYGERDPGTQREIYQSGLELIGLSEPEADGEVIALAIEALKAAGLADFKIDIGQVDFFRGVMEGLCMSDQQRLEVVDAVGRKDRSRIEELLPGLALKKQEEEILLSLPELFGGRQVLGRAAAMTKNARATAALDNLKAVMDTIDAYELSEYVTIDLGEIRGLHYYTGVIFEGFVAGIGEPLCGGGRYDTLLARYGYDAPATGFAVNVEALLRAVESQGAPFAPLSIDCLIAGGGTARHAALQVARHLRAKGFRVAREIEGRDMEKLLGYAKSENISYLIAVGGEGLPAGEFQLMKTADGEKKKYRIDDLLEGRIDPLKGR